MEIIDRWKAEMPKFWKKVLRIALVIGVIATTIWETNNAMDLKLDPTLINICKYMTLGSIISVVQAKLTKIDQPQS